MEDISFLADIGRAGLALILVVGLMVALAMVMRRLENARLSSPQAGDTQLHTVRMLDSRRRLVELHWRDEIILMLLSPNQDIVVARRPRQGNNDRDDENLS